MQAQVQAQVMEPEPEPEPELELEPELEQEQEQAVPGQALSPERAERPDWPPVRASAEMLESVPATLARATVTVPVSGSLRAMG